MAPSVRGQLCPRGCHRCCHRRFPGRRLVSRRARVTGPVPAARRGEEVRTPSGSRRRPSSSRAAPTSRALAAWRTAASPWRDSPSSSVVGVLGLPASCRSTTTSSRAARPWARAPRAGCLAMRRSTVRSVSRRGSDRAATIGSGRSRRSATSARTSGDRSRARVVSAHSGVPGRRAASLRSDSAALATVVRQHVSQQPPGAGTGAATAARLRHRAQRWPDVSVFAIRRRAFRPPEVTVAAPAGMLRPDGARTHGGTREFSSPRRFNRRFRLILATVGLAALAGPIGCMAAIANRPEPEPVTLEARHADFAAVVAHSYLDGETLPVPVADGISAVGARPRRRTPRRPAARSPADRPHVGHLDGRRGGVDPGG